MTSERGESRSLQMCSNGSLDSTFYCRTLTCIGRSEGPGRATGGIGSFDTGGGSQQEVLAVGWADQLQARWYRRDGATVVIPLRAGAASYSTISRPLILSSGRVQPLAGALIHP